MELAKHLLVYVSTVAKKISRPNCHQISSQQTLFCTNKSCNEIFGMSLLFSYYALFDKNNLRDEKCRRTQMRKQRQQFDNSGVTTNFTKGI